MPDLVRLDTVKHGTILRTQKKIDSCGKIPVSGKPFRQSGLWNKFTAPVCFPKETSFRVR
jgi:hypothetical protein